MMDRRLFLKLTGLAAAASAMPALPAAAAPLSTGAPTAGPAAQAVNRPAATDGVRLAVREPGTYQIYGQVRLRDSLVEISGISDTQWISWSGVGEAPLASFTAFEYIDRPGMTSAIRVKGGQLEALRAVPIDVE